MLLISHRGNVNGKNLEKENSPDYILEALKKGYDVEIDVWFEQNYFFLGHDKPEYKISIEFLENKSFWCHAKNIESLEIMLKNKKINCFWHQDDDVALTSKGFLWTYPNKKIISNSIAVLPELFPSWDIKNAFGCCSDYIMKYK